MGWRMPGRSRNHRGDGVDQLRQVGHLHPPAVTYEDVQVGGDGQSVRKVVALLQAPSIARNHTFHSS